MLDSRCGFMANGEFLFAAASSLLDERDAIWVCMCDVEVCICVSQNSHNNGPRALTPTVQQLGSQRCSVVYNWIAAITKKLRVKKQCTMYTVGGIPPKKKHVPFAQKIYSDEI